MEQQINSSSSSASGHSNTTAQQSVTPLMCRANCGFYGNQQCENYCSKCFKEHIRRQQDPQPPPIMHATPATTSAPSESGPTQHAHITDAPAACPPPLTVHASSPSATISDTNVNMASSSAPKTDIDVLLTQHKSDSSLVEMTQSPSESPKAAVPKNRCSTCKRKVGLTGFDCRCGGKFCSEHRYSDAHSCSFDYKAHGQQQLRKANPGCVTQKIDKL